MYAARGRCPCGERGDLPDGRRITALMFSLLGGVLIAFDGFLAAMLRSYRAAGSLSPGDLQATLIWYTCTIGILASAFLLWKVPKWHESLGVIIILSSVFSSYLVASGFVFGLFFGVVGGALATFPDRSAPGVDRPPE